MQRTSVQICWLTTTRGDTSDYPRACELRKTAMCVLVRDGRGSPKVLDRSRNNSVGEDHRGVTDEQKPLDEDIGEIGANPKLK